MGVVCPLVWGLRRLAAASPFSAESPRLTRLLCDSVAAAPAGPPRADLAAQLQLLFRDCACAAHSLYRVATVEHPAEWVAAAETGALRKSLDAIFLAPVLFYSTARPAESAAATAAAGAGAFLTPAWSARVALDTLAHVEFARMPFEAYGPLIEGSVAVLSKDYAASAGGDGLPVHCDVSAVASQSR